MDTDANAVNDQSPVGIVFDMDGVLVDSGEAHYESWRQLCEEHGRPLTREEFAQSFGQQNRDIIPQLLPQVPLDQYEGVADRKEALYRDIVRHAVPAVPGAVKLVRGLRSAGARLAIGSSGPLANIELVVEGMGIGDALDVIVSAEDVSRGKPDPQVFATACDRLQLPAKRCVVIEDAPAGVQAGKAAGAKVVAVLMHHPREALQPADVIVEKLADLSVEQLLALARAQ